MEIGRILLALETSGKSGSVAVATSRDDGSLAMEQEVLDPEWGSARTLAPAIARLLERLQWTPSNLHAIAVVQGPGSFTGLRVGAATAKTMAWALGVPLIGVDALDCVAHQVSRSLVPLDRDTRSPCLGETSANGQARLVVVSDAYRGQVFRAEYAWNASGMHQEEPTGIEDISALAERCFGSQDQRLMLAGSGVGKVLKWLQDHRPTSAHPFVHVFQGPESIPMGTTVATLGWAGWTRGETEDVLGFLPKYYRGSAAEEKKKGSGFG